MRNLDGHGLAGAKVRAAKDGGHPAAGNQVFNAVVIELVAGME
jgi:hypothetical protein